jgi:hypothetical protein
MSDTHTSETTLPPCSDDAADVLTGTAVEVLEPASPAAAPANYSAFDLLWRTCQRITTPNNPFVPKAFWSRPEAALAAILMGRELGLGDMVALQRIYVIEGRPTLSAELILGLVRRAGHSVTFDERSAERCAITGKRKDNGDELHVEWTMHDAVQAKLANKDNWKNYPRAMLHARAVTELARALFSDCIGWAVYAPEDFDAHNGGD